MVAAYWQQPLVQDDIARWLGTQGIGTPASRVQRLTQYGFEVVYTTGSFDDLTDWLLRKHPCILYVQTGGLSYWQLDIPHAVVLSGLTENQAYLFDPAVETAPMVVDIAGLMLAWSYFDYTYAVLSS
jgi:ABC-type bacteriocin/lantibiotic exporter with double-glycine peptidase domain